MVRISWVVQGALRDTLHLIWKRYQEKSGLVLLGSGDEPIIRVCEEVVWMNRHVSQLLIKSGIVC